MKVKEFIINFSIFSLSSLIGIYSVEYFLPKLSTVESSYAIAKKIDGALPLYAPWELWHTGNVFIDVDHKKLFPLGAISNQKTVYCNENNGWLIYQSDMFGFNNDDGVVKAIVNDKKQLDTLFVGDSFVNGACVPRENNFQGVFLRTGRNALGFGIGGNGPMMYLATMKEYASIVKPRNILFMYYEGNDIPQIRAEMSSPLFDYLQPDHNLNLINYQDVIDQRLRHEINTNYQRLKKHQKIQNSGFWKLKKIRARVDMILNPLKNKCEWDISVYKNTGELSALINTVAEAKRSAENIKANFFFVYLKSVNSLMNPCNYAHDEILSALRDKRINFIDTTDLFYSHGEPKYELFSMGKRGGHYSVLGYRTVATYLMTEMSREY